MKSKYLFIIFFLLALALTACTRSIVTTTEQPAAVTSEPGVPSDQEGESITLPSPGPVEPLPEVTPPVTAPVTTTVPGAPSEPVLCAYPAGWISYTIQPGDTLETISSQNAIPPEELYLANCLYAGVVLEPGKTILVPPPAQVSELPPATQPTETAPTAPSGETTTAPSGEAASAGETGAAVSAQATGQNKKENCKTNYIVRSGDWVYKIGRRCNISPYAIIAANNLRYPYWLRPGQHLYLPPNAPPFPRR